MPPTTTTERAWFLVHAKGLVVVREDERRVRLPNEAEATALGATAQSAHDLGHLERRTR